MPRAHRMVDPADFRSVIRTGSRAGNTVVVVHCRTDEEPLSPLVGFVVAKKDIPRATARNRVKRQFRHLMAERMDTLPQGTHLVVRISASAQQKSYDELGQGLDNALIRALSKWQNKAKNL
nr:MULTISPECIES: ribonuclease P protein component [unclassified Schaalia]